MLVFDGYGYLVGLSYYLEYFGPISGEYRVGGLRPGQYYVLAVGFGGNSDYYSDRTAQWYNGLELTLEEIVNIIPKMDIPAGALTVSVGTGATGGIDFYMDLPKKK